LLRHAGLDGDGFRCREGAPGDDGGGLRYRTGVLDTIGPSVGRGERAPIASGERMLCGFTATGSQVDATRWMLLVHQAAPRTHIKRPELPKKQG
jgi:hypothetical protein